MMHWELWTLWTGRRWTCRWKRQRNLRCTCHTWCWWQSAKNGKMKCCEKPLRCEMCFGWWKSKVSFSMASSAVAHVNSFRSMSVVFVLFRRPHVSDINISSSMSAIPSMASATLVDVNFVLSVSGGSWRPHRFLMPCWSPGAGLGWRQVVDICQWCSIFSCCVGMWTIVINTSFWCLLAQRCFSDGHCVRPLDLLDVSSPVEGFGMKTCPWRFWFWREGRRYQVVVVMMMMMMMMMMMRCRWANRVLPSLFTNDDDFL